ncbi:hypothetical protein F511_22266 [Dorcoceras hygrometricum]|uniref:Uncharacterized protein n=1 Tax=Dorcoceras hygrometricum TaxID=472368 RepID=A0A2Z7BWS1_9LAMI|nr:hypothetical protein F511_22266 [Dorcoceras hygrometricum]
MAASGLDSKLIGNASRIGILYRLDKRSWYIWMSSVMLQYRSYSQICFTLAVLFQKPNPFHASGTIPEAKSVSHPESALEEEREVSVSSCCEICAPPASLNFWISVPRILVELCRGTSRAVDLI